MKRFIQAIIAALSLALTFLLASAPAAEAQVAVCHKPGAKQKILTVAPQSVADHQLHGDSVVTAELCNGADDDCDGLVDEGIAPVPTRCGVGECALNEGERTCVGGVLVDSCDPLEGSTDEVCSGGFDEDCDGFIDCVDSDCDGDAACTPPCPTACADAITAWTAHDFTSHLTSVFCGFDAGRGAGRVRVDHLIRLGEEIHEDNLVVDVSTCFVALFDATVANLLLTEDEQRACAPLAAEAVEQVTGQTCDISPTP